MPFRCSFGEVVGCEHLATCGGPLDQELLEKDGVVDCPWARYILDEASEQEKQLVDAEIKRLEKWRQRVKVT